MVKVMLPCPVDVTAAAHLLEAHKSVSFAVSLIVLSFLVDPWQDHAIYKICAHDERVAVQRSISAGLLGETGRIDRKRTTSHLDAPFHRKNVGLSRSFT